jgi:hypothetical protein
VIPTSPTTRAIATIATIAIVAIRRPKPKHFSLIDQFLPPPSPGTLHGRRTLNVPNLPTLSLSLSNNEHRCASLNSCHQHVTNKAVPKTQKFFSAPAASVLSLKNILLIPKL